MARPSIIDIAIVTAALKENPRRISATLAEVLRNAILKGGLPAGARMPPSRSFARELGVARNVVTEAYAVLAAEGLVGGHVGLGTIVQIGATEITNRAARRPTVLKASGRRRDPIAAMGWTSSAASPAFEPCVPDVALLDMPDWRSCWRYSVHHGLSGDYGDPAGEPLLREEIARHISQTRGWKVGASDVLVTNGALEAITLLSFALIEKDDWIAVENPGWPLAREALRANGFDTRPIRVDLHGLDIDDLERRRKPPKAVIVTPAHQFPLGGRLPADRRQALIAWADRNGSWIIEDDYDSAFRFDVPVLPVLAAMGTSERVAHVGSFSKTLTPALRVGYIIASSVLIEQLKRLKLLLNCHTAIFTQMAIGKFMSEGFYDRHLAKARRVYSRRRGELVAALGTSSVGGKIQGIEAGLHAYWEFPSDRSADIVFQRLAKSGIDLVSIAPYCEGNTNWHGFLLGFTSPQISSELGSLSEALTLLI